MTRILRRYAQSRGATPGLEFWATTDTHIWDEVGEDPNHLDAEHGLKLFYTVPSKIRDFVGQANEAQPHMVIHAGDIVEIDGGFDYFWQFWDSLTVPSEVLPGNHDYSLPYTTTRMQAMADGLRFGSAPIVAGSRLNRTFTASGNGVSARFIAVDVNVQRDWAPVEPNGSLTPDQKSWIATELAASPEDNIFIMTHHGPHDYEKGWFVEADALDLQAMVQAEKAARPSRNIIGLFGHNHSVRFTPQAYNNMAGFPAVCIPVMLENFTSPFAKFHLTPDGELLWDTGTVAYTP